MYNFNNKQFGNNNRILFEKWQENRPTNRDIKTPASPCEVLTEFSQEGSFYGFRYTCKSGANLLERLCWTTAIITSVIFAVVFVSSAWQTFSKSPTIVNVETTNYPLNKIPFPAVTICPANFVRRRIGEKLLADHLNLTLDKNLSAKLFHVLAGLSKLQYPFYYRSQAHFPKVRRLLPLLDSIILSDFMLKVMPTCKEVLRGCYWQGRGIDCCKAFDVQRTESGFCFSFNSLTSDRTKNCTTTDEFIIDEDDTEVEDICHLRKNIASGTTTGLEVFLKERDRRDSLESGQIDPNGIRVIIHHPISPPIFGSGLYIPENRNRMFSVKVSPSVTFASSDLRTMSVSNRKCFFPDEIKSEHFRTYTQQGCIIECRLNWLIEKCGCYPYFFAIKRKGIQECNITQLNCLADQNTNIRVITPPSKGAKSAFNCSRCLPTCHDTALQLDYDTYPTTSGVMTGASVYVDICYKDLGAIKYRRERSFNTMQLVVSFGGILGLFLGISIFTGFELIFYFIMFLKATYFKFRGETYQIQKVQDHRNNIRTFPVLPPIEDDIKICVL